MNLLQSMTGADPADWQAQVDFVVGTMREMSAQTDPYEMGRLYGHRMRALLPVDASLSLSRRGLIAPAYRITRSSRWQTEVNPWKDKERLPLLAGGLLGELIHTGEPRLIRAMEVTADDPAHDYLAGHRSAVVMPMYDKGEALNMVILLRKEADAFDPALFPQMLWQANLYGRATLNLVLADQLKDALEDIDHELKAVARMQRSLLPTHTPAIPGVGVATYYQTSQRAGGDYYDFFPLPDGRWSMLIADVSGHGTPAAVLMAITHSLAHTYDGPHDRPGRLLEYLNRRLTARYTADSGSFVTAFHAIYDPGTRRLVYASAGHNPPRLKRCLDGSLALLDQAGGVPLGLLPDEEYSDAGLQLMQGDQVLLYTDGITEAHNTADKMFGLDRLDRVLENCAVGADDILRAVLDALAVFTEGLPAHDDRTMLILKLS